MRIEKVNQVIKKEIGQILLYGQLNDPRLSFITITKVEVSKDLQHAKVHFSVLTDNPRRVQEVSEGLTSARGYIRKLIGQRVVMRYTPELVFIYDKSLEYSAKIDRTLSEIKKLQNSEGAEDA